MPRGDRRTIAQRLAVARRTLADAEKQRDEADEALKIVDKRFQRADRRSNDLLDRLLAAQQERDDARQERHRLREHRRRQAERAERQKSVVDALEERQQRGLS